MIEADLGAAILTSSPRPAHSVSAAAKVAAVSMILKHMDSATVHPSSQTNPDELPRFVGFEETVVEGTKVVEKKIVTTFNTHACNTALQLPYFHPSPGH